MPGRWVTLSSSEALWILMFWHADTDGFDITADIKLPGCTLISAREMIAHQKLGEQYCHKRAGRGQTARVITRNIIPGLLFSEDLAKPWQSCALELLVLSLPDALASSGRHFHGFMSSSGSVLAPPLKELPDVLYCHAHDPTFNYLWSIIRPGHGSVLLLQKHICPGAQR